jgi:sugar/nucleoside kinase (ribokinase family)
MMDVIGFGSLNVDLIYAWPDLEIFKAVGLNLVPGMEIYAGPEIFPAVMALVDRYGQLRHKSGGGSAANTLFALSRMGFRVGMYGKVGQDAAGNFFTGSMGEVDLTPLCFGSQTGIGLIFLNSGGERSIIIFPHANSTISYEEIDRSYLSETRFLHLTSFVSDDPLAVQIKMVRALTSQVKLSFDPGEIYARKGLYCLKPILERTYVLFITEQEIEMLTGTGDYGIGARQLLAYGPRLVVCKRGARGSFLCSAAITLEIPALSVTAVDTTGAGDVYNAGFLAGMLHHLPWEQCARLATRAAARSITGYGRDEYPTRDLLTGFLQEIKYSNQG